MYEPKPSSHQNSTRQISARRERALVYSAWAYSLTLLMVSRIWTVKSPGVADAELYAYIGRAWHRGILPYTQIWENKPPGIFVVNYLASFSTHQFALLALFEFAALATTLLIVSALFTLSSPHSRLRWISPFLLANVLTFSGYSLGGNYTELYILPFAAASAYGFVRACQETRRKSMWLLLASASAAIASAFKPVGLAPLLAFLGFLCFSPVVSAASRIRAGLLAVLSFSGVWVLIGLSFARYGAARPMYYATITYNLRYGAATHTPISMRCLLTLDRLLPVSNVLACAFVALLIWALRFLKIGRASWSSYPESKFVLFFLLWAGADIVGANAGGRYYPHYFLPALLSLSVLACVGIAAVLQNRPALSRSSQLPLYCLVLLPFLLLGLRGQMEAYHAESGNPQSSVDVVAEYLKRHKGVQDTLFTWIFRPGIYRLSGTHTTTRFVSGHYLKDFPEAYQTFGPELLSELAKQPPSFILMECQMRPDGPSDFIRTGFINFVNAQYAKVYQSGDECVMHLHK